MLFSLFIALFSSASFASDSCLPLFEKHGLEAGASEQAIACYERELQLATTVQVKANSLNYLSQLHFFMSTNEDKKNESSRLERATKQGEKSALLFGGWLDEKAYAKLSLADRRLLSVALYNYGTGLARLSETQGSLTVVAKWPTIQKVMKLIMRLGHPDVAGFGAHRTLAIANTRMPAPFGDRKLAEQYLKFAIQKSDRGGFSSYLVNHTMLADLYFRQGRRADACAQLKIVASIQNEQITSKTAAGVYEGLTDRRNAQNLLKEKCAQ